MKDKNHTIISMTQKKYLTNLILFYDKNTQQARNERKLNIIKTVYKKPVASFIISGKIGSMLLRSGTRQR